MLLRSIVPMLAGAVLLGCPDSDACFDFDEDGWCDDNDCGPEDADVNGAASEDCSDGIDNDCDGHTDQEDDECSPDADAGDPGFLDPDGTVSDIGAYGSPWAASWDLDDDGHDEWWAPGGYDPDLDPAYGWDCDDQDPEVVPWDGC